MTLHWLFDEVKVASDRFLCYGLWLRMKSKQIMSTCPARWILTDTWL
mgnify:CR=1 FL=1